MLPILVPLLLIAFGAFAELGGWSTTFIAFLGDANLALFIGLLGAYTLSRATAGGEATHEAMEDGSTRPARSCSSPVSAARSAR